MIASARRDSGGRVLMSLIRSLIDSLLVNNSSIFRITLVSY